MTLFFKILLLSIITFTAYSQEKLSVKFKNKNKRITDEEMTFSISFSDSISFFKKYQDKLIIKYRHGNTVYARAHYDFVVNELVNDPSVLFIDIKNNPKTEAGIDFVNPAFNRITKVHAIYNTLIGETRKISIKEKRFDPENIDIINRSFETPLTPSDITQHATTMATLIAGGGNSSIKGTGVAPGSQITSSDFDNLLPDPDAIFLGNNIYLQNHSYGVSIENYYGNEAAAYDEQISTNPMLMHVFSAGNIGQSKPADGQYANLLYANLSGNFKQAKNVILTTAVDTSLAVNALNSRGPAYDGRLKPELAAYGQGGTSDAAALVTGISALIQEKYQLTFNELPLASTVKAILIATADDLGQSGIDYTYGYGNVNAYKALQLIDKLFISQTTVSSNDLITFPIVVDANTTQLKVAVVWSDPPATQNSSKALVHDIDCYVMGADTYLPWVLSTFPKADSLTAPAKRKKDHLNNVEYITVEFPEAGTYNLYITSPALTTDDQRISIAYWAEKKIFEWDYPLANDILEAGKKHTIFWNYPFNEKGDLYFQLNNGSWQLLKANLDLSAYQHWTTSDTLASAQLKMVINGDEFLSGEFMISPELKLNVAYNCDDDFSLSWQALENADSYQLYTLGEKYLEEKLNTTDTSVVLSKSNNGLYFSVAPKLNGLMGLRSQTINYAEQGVYCYINFFSAERFEKDVVTIQLKLSTFINVDHINIYKDANGSVSTLVSMDASNSTIYEFPDSDIEPGSIRYQAEVILKNGTIIKSPVSEVYIEAKNRAILFPNPVTELEDLNVLTEGSGLLINIINALGQTIITADLELTTEIIDVKQLPPGLYLYQLERNGKLLDTGKFVKR